MDKNNISLGFVMKLIQHIDVSSIITLRELRELSDDRQRIRKIIKGILEMAEQNKVDLTDEEKFAISKILLPKIRQYIEDIRKELSNINKILSI